MAAKLRSADSQLEDQRPWPESPAPEARSLLYDRGKRAMRLSVLVSVLMLVGKVAAFLITGSAAILSDAAESIVHIVATGFSALAYSLARKPADREHPYGHGKIVTFSIGFEGLLIFLAAVFVFIEGVDALRTDPELTNLGFGLLLTGLLGGVNLLLGVYLISVGKNIGSPVVSANGQHVLTDMWTSFLVVVGVGVVWLTGVVWLDGALAIAVSIHILYTGVNIIRRAIDQVMDYAPKEDTEEITELLDKMVRDGIVASYHQLRHRRINDVIWVELHLLVPGSMSVTEAHQRATHVEQQVALQFLREKVHVISHIEPTEHELAHPDGHEGEDPIADWED